MCGIVGLFIKDPALEGRLGELVSGMLVEMSERGPDSAGIAVYRNPAGDGAVKLVLFSHEDGFDWARLGREIGDELGGGAAVEVRASHAIVVVQGDGGDRVRRWLRERHPELRLMSAGSSIEIFKEKGLPRDVVRRFGLEAMAGGHAIGHTRMATESAVTTEHSHPFSTGLDLCLVHNGSLSNHNRLRQALRREGGVEFQTDNDSEVAAGYLTWRMGQGASLHEALEAGIADLDGFYTFCVGTRDGFAVLRDPIACKHAVLAETDGWVAMATEFRAIARLPGAEDARVWEPAPGQVYSWGRA
jgi:methylamine---glutamate N-methyltransferase subunit A